MMIRLAYMIIIINEDITFTLICKEYFDGMGFGIDFGSWTYHHLKGDDGEEPVEEPYARDGREKYKPEVEKHVDLQKRHLRLRETEVRMLSKNSSSTKHDVDPVVDDVKHDVD